MNKYFCLPFFLFFVSISSYSAQNALHFDGVNDFVQTTFSGVPGSTNRTFEAWVNVATSATSSRAILDYGLNAVGSRNTFVVQATSGQIGFLSGGTNANLFSSSNAISNGQWTHVAFVLNNGTGYLYVNGMQVGTGNLTTVNTPTTGANLTIGQRVAGGSIPFLGAIDEVRVWNIARTQMDIQRDMNTELCSASGLVAYYRFNQGTAGGNNAGQTTLPDQSGGSNNGTLQNFSLSGSTSNWVSGATLTPGVGGMATISPINCGSYISPSGKYTWTSSNTYQDTITNSAGCDSLITVNLTILNSTNFLLRDTACDNYLSPSGKFTWVTSGTYADTLMNMAGCDSFITVELVINTPTSATLGPVVCESYTSPSGNFTWTSSGVYQDILTNQNGCDSIVLVNLTVLGTQTSTVSETVCDSFISPSGNYIWKNSGTYTDTVDNSLGCDSVLIIALTVYQSTTDVRNELVCYSYTSPSGKYTWNQTGTYQDTLTNSNGCFDFVTINLAVVEIDSSVTKSGFDLIADEPGLVYQWLDCNAGLTPITGATAQQFSPLISGTYAVEITKNGCKDTSACVDVMGVGIAPGTFETVVRLYPNPNSGTFYLDLGKTYREVSVQVVDLMGKEVFVEQFSNQSNVNIQSLHLAKGSYMVKVTSDDRRAVFLMQVR
jgi:hypothetical protein